MRVFFSTMRFFDKYDLKQIEDLDLFAKQVVEGFIIGLHKSPFHGFSVEFAEHRLYNQGEPTKDIDWKVYARTDKLFSKKFEEETNLRAHIVIDVSSSMYFPKENKNNLSVNKLRFSALAAASVMNLLKRQRDAFGLSLFDEDILVHTKAKSSTRHYHLLLNHLEKLILEEKLNRKTSAVNAIHQIADTIHKRSMVIIFSDMLDSYSSLDDFFSSLLHLKHNKHEVILFHVMDKSLEIDFNFENRPYRFIDMETGEKIKLQSNELKHHYIDHMKKMQAEIRQKCLQYKIDLINTDIAQGFIPVLQAYLAKRHKMS
jgi:uncharacterized protein (DUF58 family)